MYGPNSWPIASAARAYISADGELRQHIGERDADRGRSGVHVLLGLPHVRTVFDQLRGQRHRELRGQRQLIEAERLCGLFRRQPTEQRGQGIARLSQLLLQRRQRLCGLRLGRLLRKNIQVTGGAQRPLVLHGVGQPMLKREQPHRRGNLPAQ